MKQPENRVIFCDCRSDGFVINFFPEEKYVYFSYWKLGKDARKLPWKARLRIIWNLLIKGYDTVGDDVILTYKKAREMGKFLLACK